MNQSLQGYTAPTQAQHTLDIIKDRHLPQLDRAISAISIINDMLMDNSIDMDEGGKTRFTPCERGGLEYALATAADFALHIHEDMQAQLKGGAAL